MNGKNRFTINSQTVAAKVLDNEAIIINLETGIYYSMEKTGGLIWKMFEDGCSLEEIGTTLSRQYDVSADRALEDVKRITSELVQENLLLPSELEHSGKNPETPIPEKILPYESPALNIYRDMGDLLALDPPMPGLTPSPWQNSEAK